MKLSKLLKETDALVITTSVYKERYDLTEKSVGRIFKSILPYLAHEVNYDDNILDEYANSFREGAKNLESAIKDLGTKSLKAKSLVSFGSRPDTYNNTVVYARTESLFRTHLDILHKIVEENKPYVILEDDVRLREEIYNEDVELPDDYDIIVIGGNTNEFSDAKYLSSGNPNKIERITNTRNNGHGAYATYYTPYGAKKCIEALEKIHTHLDYARKPALCEWTKSYKVIPDLLTVQGMSIRDKGVKQQNRPLTREEAKEWLR